MPRFTAAKLRKLKKNPQLFFRDLYIKNFYDKSLEISQKIPNEKLSTFTTKFIQNNFKTLDIKTSGYRYYLEQYENLDIDELHVLFDSFWGRKIGCHPYAIYKAMKASEDYKGYKFTWVKEAGLEIPTDVMNDPNVTFVEYASIAYAEALLTAKILICNSNLSPFYTPKEGQIFISTWHGIPLKTLGYNTRDKLTSVYNTQRCFNTSDILPSSSVFYTDNVIKAYGAGNLAPQSIQYIGSPRIDLILNTYPNDVLKHIDIPKGKRVALYAPTWRGFIGSVNDDISDQIAFIEKMHEELGERYELFVSLHHLTEKALGPKVESLNLRKIPKSIDINQFMVVCDLLISDYSSIFIDYLVLDKPTLLYIPDLEKYTIERGLILDVKNLPVNLCYDLESLHIILSDLKSPSQFNTYVDFMKTYLPYEDGKASKRLLELIKKPTKLEKNVKNKILITAGGLKTNGITRSLQNFIKNIDHELNEIYLLVNSELIQNDNERLNNLNKLKNECNFILTIAPKNFSLAERSSFNQFHKNIDQTNADVMSDIDKAFKREARRLFGNTKFDYVVDYTGYSTYWSLLCTNINATKRYVFLHSDMIREEKNSQKNHKYLKHIFALYPRYDQLISVSKSINAINAKNLNDLYQITSEKFVYLPNQLQLDQIQSLSCKPIALTSVKLALLQQEPDLVKFVCVGRISPEKGQIKLLEAFKLLLEQNYNAILTFVGDGPQLKRLQELAKQWNIQDRVIFLGHQSNPYNIIKQSDVLVLASEYEGQGIVLLEAMALGTPCIGSDCEAISEIISTYGGLITNNAPSKIFDTLEVFCRQKVIDFNFDATKYNNECADIVKTLFN